MSPVVFLQLLTPSRGFVVDKKGSTSRLDTSLVTKSSYLLYLYQPNISDVVRLPFLLPLLLLLSLRLMVMYDGPVISELTPSSDKSSLTRVPDVSTCP